MIPLGHWGDAEADIGRGVVYLADPTAVTSPEPPS